MAKYRVALHAHASTTVIVEADSLQEANKKALQRAPRVKGVTSWTPVMTSKLDDNGEGH